MKRTAEDNANGIKKRKTNEVDVIAGSIESITLINFMCHENFVHKFSPNVNFIIGQNGSGKSAILTAIILVLGGKSSTTGRFSNIKGFIKTGKQKAKIEITLSNRGDSAYKPDVYGDKIIVVREINSDGAGFYRLKAQDGRIVSYLKEELNNILSNMDIKVENPVTLLTQEKSRNFLLSKQPKKLYQFFYQGTGLQALEESYQETKVNHEQAKDELERKKQALPTKEKEIKELKNFLESSRRQTDFKKELMWAGVIEAEKILEGKEQELTKVEQDVAKKKEEVDQCSGAYDEKCKNLDEIRKSRRDCEAALNQHSSALEALKNDHETCAASLRKLEGALDLHQREERKLADDMASLESDINEQYLKSQNDLSEEKRKRDESIVKLKDENIRTHAAWEQLNIEKKNKMEEHSSVEEKIVDLKNEKNAHDYARERIQFQLNQARNVLKNKVNAFGEFTGQVLKAIQARKREFSKVPIGPIGLHLEVVDPKWCSAIESCLSVTLLKSFCVDNQRDSAILKDILLRYYTRPPSMIVSPFVNNVFDVRREMAKSQHPTVLHMLRIKEPVVANCLIDQVGVENCILIEDSKAAVAQMLHNPPLNCRSAYLLNCDQICLRPYRYYSNNKKGYKSLLDTRNQSDIRNLEEKEKSEMDLSHRKMSEIKQLESHLQKMNFEFRELDHQIAQYSAREKSNLEMIRDLSENEETKDVSGMEEDLQELKREHEVKRNQIERLAVEVSKSREERQGIVKQIQAKRNLLQQEKANFDELGTKLNEFSKLKETFATGKTKYEAELNGLIVKLTALTRQVENDRKLTEKMQSDAEETCPRINTTRSIDTIKRQIVETQKVIEKQSNCKEENLHKKYLEKYDQLIKAKQEYKKIENYIIVIERMLKHREDKFHSIRLQTENCIDLTFTCILHGNNYTGRLNFNNGEKTLDLVVAPRREMTTRKNHSTLSGGERSFVTISFLLALWERTSSPFRILDEYDVFMDSNNRQLSVDLLTKKAEDMGTQFVFLSPLDLPNLKPSEHIKIRRMKPPERIKGNSSIVD